MLLVTKKFTSTKYQEMIEAGILTSDDHVELIRGEIVEMSPIGTKHAACVRRLNLLLSEQLQKRALVDIQNPVELNDISAPQPDVVLLKLRADFYENSAPQPSDIFLIIEVADTTIKSDLLKQRLRDRYIKVPLYAEANINELWLVDINNQAIEVYRQPLNGSYQQKQTFFIGDNIFILALTDVSISVGDVL
jgi:Uma2 family endonuclease